MENQFFVDAQGPTWQSLSSAMEIQPTELNSTDIYGAHLESAFSSMVSSPAASNSNLSNDNFMMRELIGKLGSIGQISPQQPSMYANNNNNNNNTNTSCYSTPLNSPPKSLGMNSSVADFSADPGFAARAAKFSCFGSRSFNDRTHTNQLKINNNGNQMSGFGSVNPLSSSRKMTRVSSSPSLKAMAELANSQEESSITNADPKASKFSRKRKANAAKASEESNEKRCKSTESNGNQNDSVKAEEEDAKAPEPPKDYIHVRARRGQATDSHSLAERVRREKIGERMKLLQNLVPGCDKVTGKALMLDEIINYVQSLQRQVEFLSMKLASVNTSLDFNVESLLPKDVFQSTSLPHQIFPIDSSASPIFEQQNPILHGNGTMTQRLVDHFLDTTIRPDLNNHLSQIHQFTQTVPQYQTFCEGDLQTIVEMGFGQNQSREMTLLSENFQGSSQVSHMKVEL